MSYTTAEGATHAATPTAPTENPPSYQASSTATVISNRHNYGEGACLTCGNEMEEEFTVCGIILAILFFPIGILCCLVLRERRCRTCGPVQPGSCYNQRPTMHPPALYPHGHYPGHAPHSPGYCPQHPGHTPPLPSPGTAPYHPGYAPHYTGHDSQHPGYAPHSSGHAPQHPGYVQHPPGHAPPLPSLGTAPHHPGHASHYTGHDSQHPGHAPHHTGHANPYPDHAPPHPGHAHNTPGNAPHHPGNVPYHIGF